MSEEEQDALGNWQDRVGAARCKNEPMAVRYSATRLDRSAHTKRCLLAALSCVASTQQPLTWDSVAKLVAKKALFEQEVLSDAWGATASACALAQVEPQLPLALTNASPSDEAASSSGSSSRSSSASTSADVEDVVDAADPQALDWLLPKGPRSLLHVLHPSGEDGRAYCHKAPFVWGFTSGHGVDEAVKTS
eukprot:6464852-Amphidinium_carterae.1